MWFGFQSYTQKKSHSEKILSQWLFFIHTEIYEIGAKQGYRLWAVWDDERGGKCWKGKAVKFDLEQEVDNSLLGQNIAAPIQISKTAP